VSSLFSATHNYYYYFNISLCGKQKVKDPKDVMLKHANRRDAKTRRTCDVNGTIIETITTITNNRDLNTVDTDTDFSISTIDDDAATTSTTPTPTPTPTTPDGVLWIHVQDWSEGISHWTKTFSQVVVLCKTLNATLVLPEITDGRLVGRG
jgi:hypothetical protein